jgi:hypothetical protein
MGMKEREDKNEKREITSCSCGVWRNCEQQTFSSIEISGGQMRDGCIL